MPGKVYWDNSSDDAQGYKPSQDIPQIIEFVAILHSNYQIVEAREIFWIFNY